MYYVGKNTWIPRQQFLVTPPRSTPLIVRDTRTTYSKTLQKLCKMATKSKHYESDEGRWNAMLNKNTRTNFDPNITLNNENSLEDNSRQVRHLPEV